MVDKGKPKSGVMYSLTGGTGTPSIASGNTWAEAEFVETKEPNPPFPVEIVDVKPTEVTNKFSGEKVILQPTAIAVYDCIKGAEMLANENDGDDPKWETVRKGITWFQEHYPKEYMVLLD